MSVNIFRLDTWYLTNDSSDLYCIERDDTEGYRIVSFGTWDVICCFPAIQSCNDFMNKTCVYRG